MNENKEPLRRRRRFQEDTVNLLAQETFDSNSQENTLVFAIPTIGESDADIANQAFRNELELVQKERKELFEALESSKKKCQTLEKNLYSMKNQNNRLEEEINGVKKKLKRQNFRFLLFKIISTLIIVILLGPYCCIAPMDGQIMV